MSASRAWSDESFQEHDDTGFYIIAAALIPDDALDQVREQMLHLQAKHASTKVHWTKADSAQRDQLARAVAAFDGLHVVAVGAPVRPRRQERARAHCLNLLVSELHGFGVEHLFMEARDQVLNARDVATVQQARYALPKDARFRLDHLLGTAEPLLWVADVVAGAVRAEKLGDVRYREILGERVIDFPVDVR
ncbi:hypothetical protein [Streptomyces rugosispiralis]|uniref:DUF3800 domain-containing protein n=1 Tax=Streptomyces rugosispiralis TaxID=2967341 RepID=A0ABT1VB70_9ACTN|nr:hypothetical protein [Streptomyces rugosispiralis]MCQ8194642.1 hypothetical protein [Streptomyces rugosispiralis]